MAKAETEIEKRIKELFPIAMENKSIVIASRKGGGGKTPISISLAMDLDLFFITNDIGIATTVYHDKSKLMDNPIAIKNTIYDFGGYVAAGVIKMVEKSDLLIIPVFNDDDAFVKTILTIKELSPYAKNILILGTRTEKGDFEEIKKKIHDHFPNIKILELSKSKIFKYVTKQGTSVLQVADSRLKQWSYRKVIEQYIVILEHIKGIE